MPESVTDEEATLADLRRAVRAFVAERDWDQFHSPLEKLARNRGRFPVERWRGRARSDGVT